MSTNYFQVVQEKNTYNRICAQPCLTLCNTMDCTLPGSSVHGITPAKYWSGLPSPPPEDLPDPGIKPASPGSPAWAGRFFTTCATSEVHSWMKLLERKFSSWVCYFLFPKRYHETVFNRKSPNINTCRYCFFASLPPCDSQTACKIHHCCTR